MFGDNISVKTIGFGREMLTNSMAIELDNAIQLLCPNEYGSQSERNHRINAFLENLKLRSVIATSPHISIDAVFELVRKYQSPDDLNEYCAKVVYYDSENKAQLYKDEIIVRAVNLIERLYGLLYDGEYQRNNANTNLKFNDEYQELKKIVEEIKISKSVREIIEKKIETMKSDLNNANALIISSKEALTKAFEGKDAKLENNDFPSAVRQFLYIRFPEKKKLWNSMKKEF